MASPRQSDLSPTIRATSRSLPIALLRARERVMGPIRAMLADAGITEQQWRVLRVLEERGPCDATEIAHTACLLMPSLTRILQVLEAKKLCTRHTHPADRRRAVIDISRQGRSLISAHASETERIFADLEAEFGTDNLERLLSLLDHLVTPEEG
ncbi:homoprotocatechuate degradation operon regulator HpaR [Candidatus Rhodobacter oscarellae]|uniref:homoprotocatechuate degradation operon regulator HpaR n=1 Tax=Candidatus Rhodobacter oscarellae TaxID=1675527 RepID=UPI0006714266|nr:homoprotocatechuate degradation operon regulator HpaR [Candidatus Rhodobacter lobularis]